MAEILMPPGGQTTNSSVITKWHKKAGDQVKRGDILFSIETDKATLDIESFAEGVLVKCLYQEGDTAEAGAAVAVVEKNGSGALPAHERKPAAVPGAPAVESKPAVFSAAEIKEEAGMQKPLASPLAKSTARQNGVVLSAVPSASGIIKKADVLKHIDKRSSISAPSGNPAFIIIDINVSVLNGLLLQYNAVYGKQLSYEKYVAKAFETARREFKGIERFEIAEVRKTTETAAAVSAAVYGNAGRDVIFGFIARVKTLMDNILLLLAV